MLEKNSLWEKIRLKFDNDSVEPIIEFPNIFVCFFANLEALRVKGVHTFFFTPPVLEISFNIFRGFDAFIRETINPTSSTPSD
jgi:hypothetical protein